MARSVMVRQVARLAAIVILVLTYMRQAPAASLRAAANPLATPVGMVRFYLRALGTGQCDLAFKLAGQHSRSLSAFRRDCHTIRRITIERLDDPGYRLYPQTAAYTCLPIHYTVYRRSGAMTFGGWYLMERTFGSAWSILHDRSHVTVGGKANSLTRAQCASRLPSYVHRGSRTIVAGSTFLTAAYGWIALSTSGAYVLNGSCTHGIGTNCESAATTIFRTDDAGRHWTPLLHVTTATWPPPWIRLFNRQVGLVAATVGPFTSTANARPTAALFSTHDGGRHWQRFPLPVNYDAMSGTISFPDPRHGWLWYGSGAMGSMAVDVYRTSDGGRHWKGVACASFSNPGPGYTCGRRSGISLGGDKTYMAFKDAQQGWFEADEHSGVPDIYHTADGGMSWRRQAVGLPPGVSAFPKGTGRSTTYASGTLLPPSAFGSIGILPEEVGFYQSQSQSSRTRLYIYRSTDGGQIWRPAPRTPVTAPIAQWQALDARHWQFLANTAPGHRQSMWETANGGRSWTEYAIQPSGLTLVTLEMVNRRDGWASAQTHADPGALEPGTVLLRTTDGGRHWRQQKAPWLCLTPGAWIAHRGRHACISPICSTFATVGA